LPVLCLHGLTRNSADFENVAPALALSGRRVLAIDVRGRGRSSWDSDFSRYRPDIYASDVLCIFGTLGIDRAVFIGTSMGGLITMLVSALAQQRIAGAVLNDVGPVINPAGLARIARYVGEAMVFESWEAVAEALCRMQGTQFPKADAAFWLRMARRAAREKDGRIVLDYDPAIAKALPPSGTAAPDLRPLFHSLMQSPILVVRGALSDILAAEGVAAMREMKPDLDYVQVSDVGHAPTLEEPSAGEALANFLRRIP